jgi:hypothetical protein
VIIDRPPSYFSSIAYVQYWMKAATERDIHVSAEGGIDAALVAPALCFEEIHHIRINPDRELFG